MPVPTPPAPEATPGEIPEQTSGETPLDVPRTWVEFIDPAQPGQRFRCDLTWLTSHYRCIYGAGCLGIAYGRGDEGCCTFGAHFTDTEDLARVRAAVRALGPQEWQLRQEAAAAGPDGWWEQAEGAPGEAPERKTRLHDGACVLLNRAGFPGGPGCALHRHALAAGIAPHTTKPDVCWQLPIRRAYRTVSLPDETDYLEVTIGEFDRRGWGPGGHELDWYCTGSPLAHAAAGPLYRGAETELRELMGDAAYEVLATHCAAHRSLVAAASAAPGGYRLLPLLVHPATLAARDIPADQTPDADDACWRKQRPRGAQ